VSSPTSDALSNVHVQASFVPSLFCLVDLFRTWQSTLAQFVCILLEKGAQGCPFREKYVPEVLFLAFLSALVPIGPRCLFRDSFAKQCALALNVSFQSLVSRNVPIIALLVQWPISLVTLFLISLSRYSIVLKEQLELHWIFLIVLFQYSFALLQVFLDAPCQCACVQRLDVLPTLFVISVYVLVVIFQRAQSRVKWIVLALLFQELVSLCWGEPRVQLWALTVAQPRVGHALSDAPFLGSTIPLQDVLNGL